MSLSSKIEYQIHQNLWQFYPDDQVEATAEILKVLEQVPENERLHQVPVVTNAVIKKLRNQYAEKPGGEGDLTPFKIEYLQDSKNAGQKIHLMDLVQEVQRFFYKSGVSYFDGDRASFIEVRKRLAGLLPHELAGLKFFFGSAFEDCYSRMRVRRDELEKTIPKESLEQVQTILSSFCKGPPGVEEVLMQITPKPLTKIIMSYGDDFLGWLLEFPIPLAKKSGQHGLFSRKVSNIRCGVEGFDHLSKTEILREVILPNITDIYDFQSYSEKIVVKIIWERWMLVLENYWDQNEHLYSGLPKEKVIDFLKHALLNFYDTIENLDFWRCCYESSSFGITTSVADVRKSVYAHSICDERVLSILMEHPYWMHVVRLVHKEEWMGCMRSIQHNRWNVCCGAGQFPNYFFEEREFKFLARKTLEEIYRIKAGLKINFDPDELIDSFIQSVDGKLCFSKFISQVESKEDE